MNNLFFITLVAGLSLEVIGCGTENNPGSSSMFQANFPTEKDDAAEENLYTAQSKNINTCFEGSVPLPNYGDPAHRLKNCFVEYPGEPSRQDKYYYIVEDICGQFTKEFMENMFGQKFAKIEPPKVSNLNSCSYFLDDKRNVILSLEYLKIENQKTGNEAMGNKVIEDTAIPMNNLVVYQNDGSINVVYLILIPEKFLSLRSSTADVFKNDDFIQVASRIAENIKDYR
jgi:hypothetical protein